MTSTAPHTLILVAWLRSHMPSLVAVLKRCPRHSQRFRAALAQLGRSCGIAVTPAPCGGGEPVSVLRSQKPVSTGLLKVIRRVGRIPASDRSAVGGRFGRSRRYTLWHRRRAKNHPSCGRPVFPKCAQPVPVSGKRERFGHVLGTLWEHVPEAGIPRFWAQGGGRETAGAGAGAALAGAYL